jgi:hypothetical protein
MPAGRPTVITPQILAQLYTAFSIGCTDEEAIAFANVSNGAFYDYQKLHPEFLEEKERLKKLPILKAKNTVVQGLDRVQNAMWYLERKKKDEFSVRTETTGADGKDLIPLDDTRVLKTLLTTAQLVSHAKNNDTTPPKKK